MLRKVLLISIFLGLATQELYAENNFLKNLSNSLELLWQKKSCSSTSEATSNYTIVSLACKGNYSYKDRLTFLDFVFKNHLQIEKEEHRIEKTDGFYLYRLVQDHNSKPLFIKLYFRSAKILWPNDLGKIRIAFFVSNVESSRQVIEWKELSIDINYALNPFAEEAQKIYEQVKSYGQSVWVDLPYQNRKNNSNQTLTIQTTAHEKTLDYYLDQVFASVPQPDGFLTGGGNYFSFNTFAVRNLIKNLKKRKVPLILDVNKQEKISYATAQILGQKSYWVDYVLTADNIAQVWEQLKKKSTNNNLVVIQTQADARFVYNFIEKQISNIPFEFVLLPHNRN